MTSERALELAAMYSCSEAAAPLLMRLCDDASEERRTRAGLALAVLDPLVPLSVEGASWLWQLLHEESARDL